MNDFANVEALAAAGAGRLARTPLQQFVEQPLDVFQTKLDSEALEAVEPTERVTVIDRRVSRRANPRGLARPSRSAPAGSIHGATVK